MYKRITQIREAFGLSQEAFGKRIGLSRFAISNYESNKRNIGDRTIADICREFNVNEAWLRTGEGEMLHEDDESFIGELSAKYNLDPVGQQILRVFVGLPPSARAAVQDFVLQCASGLAPLLPENQPDPIDAEIESYRRELEAEAKGAEKSEASDTGNEKTS